MIESILTVLSINVLVLLLILIVLSPVFFILLGFYLVEKVNLWEKSNEK